AERRELVEPRPVQHVVLLALAEDQLAIVAGRALHRVAAVHRAAALAELPALLFRRVLGEDEVARLDAERAEQAHPELVRGPDVQDARDADAELRPRRRGRGGTRPSEPARQR